MLKKVDEVHAFHSEPNSSNDPESVRVIGEIGNPVFTSEREPKLKTSRAYTSDSSGRRRPQGVMSLKPSSNFPAYEKCS
ncbi:MAG: hypothetical protein ABI548_02245 [Polyangiaceae bacterium]